MVDRELNTSVEIKNYSIFKREEANLVGIEAAGKNGKRREILAPNFMDVAFGKVCGRTYLAAKPFGSDTFTVFCKSKDYSVDGVYDLLFTDKSIWVKKLFNGSLRWEMLSDELKTIKSFPNFDMPSSARCPAWYLCNRRNKIISVSLKDDGENFEYAINLENGEFTRYSPKKENVDKEVKKITGYNIRVSVVGKRGKMVAIDSNGKEYEVCILHNFESIRNLVDKLLNKEPILSYDWDKQYGCEYLYKALDVKLAKRFISVFKTIKNFADGAYIAYLVLYLVKSLGLKLGTLELLDKLDNELRTGYREVANYISDSGVKCKVECKLYRIKEALVCIHRTITDRYTSRLSADISLNAESLDFSLLDDFCKFDINHLEVTYNFDNTTASVEDYPNAKELGLGSAKSIKSAKYTKELGLKLYVSHKDVKKLLRVKAFCNFIYVPKERKNTNKVYMVTSYCSVLDTGRMENV